MRAAYRQVTRNAGAPGIDGMKVEELGPHLREEWPRIKESMLDDRYQPQPVKPIVIAKPGGGVRQLGIPTVVDRIIQQALHQVMSVVFEPEFSESSYGFRPLTWRPRRGAERRGSTWPDGKRWVVDMDLEKFFDRVSHDVLMARVARKVGDKRVLRLVRRYLEAGVMDAGLVSPRTEGTPQGGPRPPLLSNILLDELDKELERRGHTFCRYADDCNNYVRSKRAGERVMSTLEGFLRKRLRLRVNRAKSAVDRPWKRKFLGYSMTVERTPRLKMAPESERRLRDKLKAEFRRARGRSLDRQMQELRPLLIRLVQLLSTRAGQGNLRTAGRVDPATVGLRAVAAVEEAPKAGGEAARRRPELRTRLDFGLQRSRPVVERRRVAPECGAPETLL